MPDSGGAPAARARGRTSRPNLAQTLAAGGRHARLLDSAYPHSALLDRASPLSASPLSAYPHSAYPHSAYPHSAYPHSAYPLSAYPLSASPLSASPLSAYPHSALLDRASPHRNRQDGSSQREHGNGRWRGARTRAERPVAEGRQ